MNQRIKELADQAMVTRGRMRVIDEGRRVDCARML